MSEVSAPILPFREIGFVLLAATALYAFLAIASYSPMDPSWGHASADVRVSNLVGISGAWIAEFVLLAFGWVAYLLVAGLVVAGGRLIATRGLPWSWTVVGIGFLGSSHWCLPCACCLECTRLRPLNFLQVPEERWGIHCFDSGCQPSSIPASHSSHLPDSLSERN